MSTIVIAEAGVNHNGNLELAKKMIEKAKEAGADYIKFQTFSAEQLVVRETEKSSYQKIGEKKEETQFEMLKKLELPFKGFYELKNFCCEKNIGFLSTPFDLNSITFLDSLSMDYWKIPSGEITNYPYLIKIAKTNKPIILSTGMSTVEEIQQAISVLNKNKCGKIIILHCNTEYPTPYEDVNMRAMLSLKKIFKVPIGYSDHTNGIEVAIAAVAMGATIIEKHFTLDKSMEGPDHKASLNPKELKNMIIAIRNIEKALGSPQKRVTETEKKNLYTVRKSIVAKQKILKGETYTEDNLTVKRPGNGISPMEWETIIGTIANKNYEVDEQIKK